MNKLNIINQHPWSNQIWVYVLQWHPNSYKHVFKNTWVSWEHNRSSTTWAWEGDKNKCPSLPLSFFIWNLFFIFLSLSFCSCPTIVILLILPSLFLCFHLFILIFIFLFFLDAPFIFESCLTLVHLSPFGTI